MIDSKTISVAAILVNLMGTTVAFAMEDKDQSFTASKTVRQLPPHVSPQTPDEFDPSTLNLVKLAVTLEKEKEDPKIESSLAGIKPPELNGGDFVAVNRPNGVVFYLCTTQQYGKYFIEWKTPSRVS
ncbi:MAG: hypothetical protein BGO67_07895 [Alphaproteobacteria bacterium 41-28]|nr:MAG: hypothetical protein BGO67_07895 [Alphaproteobacteria bacterium 41-28]